MAIFEIPMAPMQTENKTKQSDAYTTHKQKLLRRKPDLNDGVRAHWSKGECKLIIATIIIDDLLVQY